ncbi:hypothetical protein SRHO_G00148160 [Serrasalmus rhombeus]
MKEVSRYSSPTAALCPARRKWSVTTGSEALEGQSAGCGRMGEVREKLAPAGLQHESFWGFALWARCCICSVCYSVGNAAGYGDE